MPENLPKSGWDTVTSIARGLSETDRAEAEKRRHERSLRTLSARLSHYSLHDLVRVENLLNQMDEEAERNLGAYNATEGGTHA